MSRRLFTSTIIALSLSACQQSQNTSAGGNASIDTDTTSQTSNKLAEYKLFLSKLDTLNVNSTSQAAQEYQTLFSNEDSTTRDSGFVVFNTFYESLDRNINELHAKDTTNYDALVPNNTAKKELPQNLQAFADSLKQNAFQVESTEGITYIAQDRDVLAEWFYPYVSSTLKEYLSQLNKENKEGFAVDAGLTISPQQFVDRVIWWENFIQQNPSFILSDQAKATKKDLLTFLLEGMENTPIRSYEDGSIETYYKTAYTYLQNRYPNSETNMLVSPYYKALLQKDNAKAKALLNEYRSKGYTINFSRLEN